jgi:phosphoserine phosphatase
MFPAVPARALITITGPDQSGLTARLMQRLAEVGATLADVEQVVVQGHVTLCLLIDPLAPPALESVRAEAASLGLSVRVDTAGTGQDRATRDDWVVTLIGETLGPQALYAVTNSLTTHGTRIAQIRRLTDDDLSALELHFSLPAGDDAALPLKRALFDLSLTHRFDIAIPVNVIPGLHGVGTSIRATTEFDTLSI